LSLLKRIKIATIGAPDLDAIKPLYKDWIGYSVISEGIIRDELAASWGTPDTGGRPYILMQPESGVDVFIRAIQIDPVPDYKPMTTYGWNAIEIIIDAVDDLHEKLKLSPFTIIGEPRNLGSYKTIRAMQVTGPANEVLYLTCETGDRSDSLLPLPKAFVGRPFIMVVAGPNIQRLQDWYANKFQMEKRDIRDSNIDIIQRAQDLPEDHFHQITILRMENHGNILELDGYPANSKPRPRNEGQLPPGVAMTSLTVADLNALNLDYIMPPIAGYGGSRTATVVGPAGELIELIEEEI